MSEYFYGWYFRCQGREGGVAVIPAVHLSGKKCSCSIQVMTERGSLYREFPIAQFRINRKKGILQIGENLFSRKGIRLNLEAVWEETCVEGAERVRREGDRGKEKRVMLSGLLRFGRFSEPKYDIMGPFALLSGMECRHTVYSMRHTVDGVLRLGEEKITFQNGVGYMEGDSGTSFPENYIWTHHFLPGGSLMVAAASIPLAGIRFTGTIGFLLVGNREYRFATYLGAYVERMNEQELLIRQGRYRLQVRFRKQGGSMLKAPRRGSMTRRVRESIACAAEYTLTSGERILLHVVTHQAAAECEVR